MLAGKSRASPRVQAPTAACSRQNEPSATAVGTPGTIEFCLSTGFSASVSLLRGQPCAAVCGGMASLRVDVSVTPDDMPIAPLTKRAFDPATMAPPVMASPLAIGVASITSNIASGLHVPVPSKLSRNLTRPQSCFVKAEGLHGDGSPVASDNTSPPRRGSLRGGLDAMFTAASEGEVMTRFIGTVHGDSPPASEGDGSAIPSHLRDVSFGPGAQGSDVLRRSAMGRRPSALDIETSIRTGKINRAISLPNSPAGLAPDTARSWLKTDLAIIGNFSSDAAPMSPMRGAFPMRQPMMSASRRTSRMAPSPASINVTVAKATDTSTATTGSNDHSAAPSPPSRAFTFSSHHTDSPRSHDSPAPDVPTPKYPPNTSPVRVDTMVRDAAAGARDPPVFSSRFLCGCVLQALWKRVRTAFMKFAEARAAEIEDLFVAQQQRAKDAVNSGKVSTVDKGENVPLKNQGDLAHYTLVSACGVTGAVIGCNCVWNGGFAGCTAAAAATQASSRHQASY